MKSKEEIRKEWLYDLGRNLEQVCIGLGDIGATQDTLKKAYETLDKALEETPYAIGHVELLEDKELSDIIEKSKLALSRASNVRHMTSEEINNLDCELEELVQKILNPHWS